MLSKLKIFWSKRNWFSKFLFFAIPLCLILIKFVLPIWIKHRILAELNAIEGYSAEMKHVEVSILSTSISFVQLKIFKSESGSDNPIFYAKRIEGRPYWSEFVQGNLYTHVTIERPQLNFFYLTGDEFNLQDSTANNFRGIGEVDWKSKLNSMFVFEVNRLSIKEGSINYYEWDNFSSIHLSLHDIYGTFKNLKNKQNLNNKHYAQACLNGRINERGNFDLEANFNPKYEAGSYSLQCYAHNLYAQELNKFLTKYANLDTEDGVFNFEMELASENGELDGFIYPEVENLSVLDLQADKNASLKNKIWQGIVEFGTELLAFDKDHRDKTQIKISGRLNALHLTLQKSKQKWAAKKLTDIIDKRVSYTVDFQEL